MKCGIIEILHLEDTRHEVFITASFMDWHQNVEILEIQLGAYECREYSGELSTFSQESIVQSEWRSRVYGIMVITVGFFNHQGEEENFLNIC